MARMNEAVPADLRPGNWDELLGALLDQGWGFWPVHNRLKAAAGRAKSPEYIARVLLNMAKETPVPPSERTPGNQPGARTLPSEVHTASLELRTRSVGRTIDAHHYDQGLFHDYCDYCQLPKINHIHTVS